VVAYTERLRQNVGGKLVTRGNWGDAKSMDPERFWEQKLRCSPGFLSVLDPDLFAVGPSRVKAFAAGKEVFLTAGLDAVLMQNGPVDAIVERVKSYIDAMARGGRFTLYLNDLPADTPPEHIHAAVAACRAYGQYPIAEDLDRIAFHAPKRESFADFAEHRGWRI
jgi:hypothetical protein